MSKQAYSTLTTLAVASGVGAVIIVIGGAFAPNTLAHATFRAVIGFVFGAY